MDIAMYSGRIGTNSDDIAALAMRADANAVNLGANSGSLQGVVDRFTNDI